MRGAGQRRTTPRGGRGLWRGHRSGVLPIYTAAADGIGGEIGKPRPVLSSRLLTHPRSAMPISLPDASRASLVDAIQHYFRDARDEEIGQLQAGFFLDFVLEHVGPAVYNQAIRDAQAHLQRTVTDLDLTLHEPEPVR